jgi:hypothetical protein
MISSAAPTLRDLSAENESQERKIIEIDSRPSECIAMATPQTARYVSRIGSENANSRVVERRVNTFLHTAYRAANPPLTHAFVTSYDSWLDYCSVAVLNFSRYGSRGNPTKGTGSGSKSDSDFYHDPPREGLGVYRPM